MPCIGISILHYSMNLLTTTTTTTTIATLGKNILESFPGQTKAYFGNSIVLGKLIRLPYSYISLN